MQQEIENLKLELNKFIKAQEEVQSEDEPY